MAGRVIHGIDIGAVEPAADAAMYRDPLGLTHCRPDERIPVAHLDQLQANVVEGSRVRVFEERVGELTADKASLEARLQQLAQSSGDSSHQLSLLSTQLQEKER